MSAKQYHEVMQLKSIKIEPVKFGTSDKPNPTFKCEQKPIESMPENKEDVHAEVDELAKYYIDILKKLKDPNINALLKEIEEQSLETSLITPVTELLYQLFKKAREEVRKLKQELDRTKKSLQHTKQICSALSTKYKQLIKNHINLQKAANELTEKTIFEQTSKIYLDKHLQVLHENFGKPANSYRYPDELKPFYVLFSFTGEYCDQRIFRFSKLPSRSRISKRTFAEVPTRQSPVS